MPKTTIQKRLMHNADDLLNMIVDVENYPVFINLITSVRILSRNKIDETNEEFEADLAIHYKFISETFRSKVSVDRKARRISIAKARDGGAVRALENIWVLTPLSDGSTQLDFSINVKLKSSTLDFLIRKKFEKAIISIMGAFEARAKQICKPAGDSTQDLRLV